MIKVFKLGLTMPSAVRPRNRPWRRVGNEHATHQDAKHAPSGAARASFRQALKRRVQHAGWV